MHLSLLFKGMARHKIVPDSFGVGVIIPLLKDKEGDCNSIDNYRGRYHFMSRYFQTV